MDVLFALWEFRKCEVSRGGLLPGVPHPGREAVRDWSAAGAEHDRREYPADLY